MRIQIYRQIGTAALLGSLFLGIACGKSVSLDGSASPGNSTSDTKNPPGGSNQNSNLSCQPQDVLHWTFTQAESHEKGLVDLLFVVDTSESMKDKRVRIAKQISAWTENLKGDVDYQIAVMLAHGGASPYSGTLFSGSGGNSVLKSTTLSETEIKAQLQDRLQNPPADRDEADGEMMIYSFLRSLDSDRINKIQNAGFYRKDANWSIVFVSDENDVCYPPQLYGFTQFPDYVPSWNGVEMTAYRKYCPKVLNTAFNTPSQVLGKLKNYKDDSLFSVGGIVHMNPNQVPQTSEESIGHGIIETVQSTLNSSLMEIADLDYTAGLETMASITSGQIRLQTVFSLSGNQNLDWKNMLVQVDGVTVNSTSVPAERKVQISAQNAGKNGSIIEISACPAI